VGGLLGGCGPACPAGDAPPPAGRTRAFLKVQNGCDARCAFCIIPTTRGPAESRPLEAVLRDGRRRLAEGHPELVLTGINIGTYREPESGADLADVVRRGGGPEGLPPPPLPPPQPRARAHPAPPPPAPAPPAPPPP